MPRVDLLDVKKNPTGDTRPSHYDKLYRGAKLGYLSQGEVDPYWGERDTNIHFCEPPYVRSIYVAEFWNSWTNLIAFGGAIYSFVKVWRKREAFMKAKGFDSSRYKLKEKYFPDPNKRENEQQVVQNPEDLVPKSGHYDNPHNLRDPESVWMCHIFLPVVLMVIGLGSFFMHGTQRYGPELVDELGLMFFTVLHQFAVMDLHVMTRGDKYYIFRFVLPFINLACAIAYVVHHYFEIFITAFTLTLIFSCYCVLEGYPSRKENPTKFRKRDFAIMFAAIFGRSLWQLEFIFCRGDYFGTFGREGLWQMDREANWYETDLILWGHPLFHIFCYSAMVHLIERGCNKNALLYYLPASTGSLDKVHSAEFRFVANVRRASKALNPMPLLSKISGGLSELGNSDSKNANNNGKSSANPIVAARKLKKNASEDLLVESSEDNDNDIVMVQEIKKDK